MLRRTLPVLLLSLSCPFAVYPAAADPVRVTAGSLIITGLSEVGSLSMTGTQGFSLDARVVNTAEAFWQCSVPECVGGTPLDLFIHLGGPTLVGATATLNGVDYPDVDGAVSPAYTNMFFRGTAIAPPIGDQPTTVTAPFTLEGKFFLVPEGEWDLTGAGTATLSLRPYPTFPGFQPSWVVDRIQYEFSGPGPVPEPATLVLVGGGLAGMIAARRRRLAGRPPRL
jgi:hypothetical protein